MPSTEIGFFADRTDHPYIRSCLQPYNISVAADNEGEFRNKVLGQTPRPMVDFCLAKLTAPYTVGSLFMFFKQNRIDAKIIVLTEDPTMPLPVPPRSQAAARKPPPRYADAIARALKDGAFGYIQTAASSTAYGEVIDKVLYGRATIEPIVAQALRPLLGHTKMTPSEKTVFRQLLTASVSQSAINLGETEDYIEKRLYNILWRLHP